MGVDFSETRELKERVVEINRVAKVVKGGRRFSFTALVVVGDEVDRVGVGYGKAREVPLAITKAVEDAKKNMFTVPKHGSTITHEVLGRFDAARVMLRPASEGTGVIAGGGVRAVLELGGVRNVLAKSLGTTNPINMAKATVAALKDLRRPEDVARIRGKQISEVLPVRRIKPSRRRPSQRSRSSRRLRSSRRKRQRRRRHAPSLRPVRRGKAQAEARAEAESREAGRRGGSCCRGACGSRSPPAAPVRGRGCRGAEAEAPPVAQEEGRLLDGEGADHPGQKPDRPERAASRHAARARARQDRPLAEHEESPVLARHAAQGPPPREGGGGVAWPRSS